MSSDVAIQVQGVRKHYLLFRRPEDRLKQSIVPRLQRLVGLPPTQYYRDFAALNDISFEVRRGETVGIVGRNGSGKSTLLQIICGILQPTAGSAKVNGRIAALLGLGAGFNPEFTGRENVYLSSAILGLTRAEIDRRFESIVRFADIGDFIEQPVKTYSSGMNVRLAFATAINADPDILVVDEALAVGDEAFRRKCYARIEEIQARGATILFVSHGAQTVIQLCSRALLIDAGEKILEGEPKLVVGQYQRLVNLTGAEAKSVREEIRCIDGASAAGAKEEAEASSVQPATTSLPAPQRSQPSKTVAALEGYDPRLQPQSRVEYERHGAAIRDLRLINSQGREVNILELGRRYVYEYFVDFSEDASDVGFGMLVKTTSGIEIGGATTAYSRALRMAQVRAGSTVRIRFEFDCCFLPGTYFLNAGVLGATIGQQRYLHRILDGLAFRVPPVQELIATALVDLDLRPDLTVFAPGQMKPAKAG